MLMLTKEINIEIFQCKYCDKQLSSKQSLNTHIQTCMSVRNQKAAQWFRTTLIQQPVKHMRMLLLAKMAIMGSVDQPLWNPNF